MKYVGNVVDQMAENTIIDLEKEALGLTTIEYAILRNRKSNNNKFDMINIDINNLNLIREALIFYYNFGNELREIKKLIQED